VEITAAAPSFGTPAGELAMVSVSSQNRNGHKGATVSVWAIFLSVLVASACSRPASEAAQAFSAPVTLTIGLPVQTGEDPLHGASQAARLLSFEGLTYLARDGRAHPKLAETLNESADGLTWTVQLRRNAFFHDGSAADAASIKQSLERSLKGADRDRSPGLSDIVAIEAPSDYTLVIRLRERSRFLLDDLTVAIVKPGPRGATVGTGPFVTNSTANNELVMTAVANYYRGKPTIERIVWKSYPAVRTAWAAMMRGEIDFLYQVPPEAVEFIEAEDSVKLFSFLRNYTYHVVFNSKRKPFDDWQVRKALNYAINRERLITRAFDDRGQVASGPLWPLHWAYDSSVPSYSFDPARAIALLNAAKIPEIHGFGRSDSAPGRFHFTCLVPDNFALWERMALIVQRDLAEIGVVMRIESVPFEVFNQRIGSGDFDAVTIELIVGNTASRPFTFWSSQSTQNVWGYRNADLDRALEDLRRASDDTAYRNAFRRVQEQALENPPAIFLALGQVTRAVSDRFDVVAPPNTDILPSIPDWRLATPNARTTN
jgi:peptide/nickel transport system substrate-binding protein